MGSMYQSERQRGNPLFNPPLYEGVSFTFMTLSNSILAFVRKDIGHRTLHPRTILPPFLLHMGLGYVSYHDNHLPLYARQGGLAMMIYAIALFVLTGYHERRGLKLAFRAHNPVHTMSRGRSIFRRRASSGGEQLLVLGLGIYMIHNLGWYLLGWWLILGAISLGYVETVVKAHTQNAVLDVRDSQAEANFLHAAQTRVTRKPQTSRSGNNNGSGVTIATLAPELRLPQDDARPPRRGLLRRK